MVVRRVLRFVAIFWLLVAGATSANAATARQSEEASKARAELRDRIEQARKSLGVEPRQVSPKSSALDRVAQWVNWPNWNNWANWPNWFNQWRNW
jgi:hypothetical protein